MTVTLHHPRYSFDRWIAAGGMGEVWQATDTLLEREVAVKVLRPELAADSVLRARFAAEARHAGSLQHPHVASVLDYGELDGVAPTPTPFLVMELVEGEPVSALLAREEALPPPVAADLIAQAAEGLEAAHALGIVHRDVKPGNLLVTADGQVKVTDFGVARAADTASLTMTGHLIGTPHYISPEQAEGAPATPLSDVYSLGIVLFECLTGRKPFVGDSPVITAVMHIREPLPPFPDAVPERLQRIARMATAKEPAARFRSAGALAAALRDESPDTRTYLLPSTGAPAVADDSGPGRRRLTRHRLLASAGALLLVVGVVWAATASSDDPSRVPSSAPTAAETSADGEDRVRVRASELEGLPVADARRQLKELGLRSRTETVANEDDREAGTVAGVAPTGLVDPDARVTLSVWSDPPVPQPADTGGGGGSEPSSAGTAEGSGQDAGPAEQSGGGGGPTAGDRPGEAPAHSNAGGNGKAKGGGPGKSGKGGKR